MKKLLVSMALTASMTGAAFAADLPAKAPVMAPVAVGYSWTGCYIAAGAGYGMWNQDHQTLDPTGVPFRTAAVVTTGGRGWFGTGQVGCDYQFSDRWVVGVFGDYDFASIKGTLSPSVTNTLFGEEKLKDSWAVGGRLGYVIFPRLLGYVSGGYTQARFDGVTFASFAAAAPTTLNSQTYKGWFLGSGYEYGLDFLPGLFWKTEYRFSQFRAEDPAILNGTGILGYEHSQKYEQTIRSELVYRFNWGGPVVAKY